MLWNAHIRRRFRSHLKASKRKRTKPLHETPNASNIYIIQFGPLIRHKNKSVPWQGPLAYSSRLNYYIGFLNVGQFLGHYGQIGIVFNIYIYVLVNCIENCAKIIQNLLSLPTLIQPSLKCIQCFDGDTRLREIIPGSRKSLGDFFSVCALPLHFFFLLWLLGI